MDRARQCTDADANPCNSARAVGRPGLKPRADKEDLSEAKDFNDLDFRLGETICVSPRFQPGVAGEAGSHQPVPWPRPTGRRVRIGHTGDAAEIPAASFF